MEARRDVFQAIADPTRREIIKLVAKQSLNLNAIAENFDVSRPAISQHIKILTECGLIMIIPQGRERYCEAKLEKLNEVTEWVEEYTRIWKQRFDSLENYLEEVQTKNKRHASKKSTRKKSAR
jgi:DNA-binding transcriptional ArsR family regulator